MGLEWLLAGAAGRMRYGLKVLVYVALSLTKLFFAIRFVLKYGAFEYVFEELSLLKIHRYLYTAHRNSHEQATRRFHFVPGRPLPCAASYFRFRPSFLASDLAARFSSWLIRGGGRGGGMRRGLGLSWS